MVRVVLVAWVHGDETKAQMGNLRLTATALMLHCISEDTPALDGTQCAVSDVWSNVIQATILNGMFARSFRSVLARAALMTSKYLLL